MTLIRCASCRYSFEHVGEHVGDAPPTTCPQCGGSLRPGDAAERDEPRKDRPTQRMRTIPKPKE